MIVLVSGLLVVFLVVAAFSVDIAYMFLVRTELRAATDAAAKAGAEALTRHQDQEKAVTAALKIAGHNLVAGRPLVLDPNDILVGQSMQNSDGSWYFSTDTTRPNAVQVSARMSPDSPSGSVNLFFGPIFGKNTFQPSGRSTAAHYEQELCLTIDRSHSMCFDLSGVDWKYPPSIPAAPKSLKYPPHHSKSRWAALENSLDIFLKTVQQLPYPPEIALVTWGSTITKSSYEGQYTGRTFNASDLDVPLGDDYAKVEEVIKNRGDDIMLGGTNMSAGMDHSIAVLTGSHTRPLANKTIILMTDGQWNQGRSPVLAAEDARRAGIVVHTITFLPNSDQKTMRDVAELTGGRHYHAHDEASLKAAFRELALTLPIVLIE